MSKVTFRVTRSHNPLVCNDLQDSNETLKVTLCVTIDGITHKPLLYNELATRIP